MVELCVRLAVCAGLFILAMAGVVPIDPTWKIVVGLTGVSLLAWRAQTTGRLNPGIAGMIAVAEALGLSLILGAGGYLDRYGFLVIVPCAIAAAHFGAPMVSMAPLAASAIVAASALRSQGATLEPAILVQAGGLLAVSLLLGNRRRPEKREGEAPLPLEGLGIAASPVRPEPQWIEDGVLQLRESYRKLRDAYADLERRARSDKVTARIGKLEVLQGDSFFAELAKAARELSGAEGVAVYTIAQAERKMIVRSFSERFPDDVAARPIECDLGQAQSLIRERAEEAIAACCVGSRPCTALLTHAGRPVGLLCGTGLGNAAEEVRQKLVDLAPAAARAVAIDIEREHARRRIAEMEILYELSSTVSGAASPASLSARVTAHLCDRLGVDGLAVVMIESGRPEVLASQGADADIMGTIRFADGSGLEGWIAAGFPEAMLFDARQDPQCDPDAALRLRIGSCMIVPLRIGSETRGYMAAMSRIAGGIDSDQIGCLRLVGAELSRSIERLSGTTVGGLMTPSEFTEATRGRSGCLVYIEPLRREKIMASVGAAAFEAGTKKLAHRLRALLPPGSCLCRRKRGDFVAFLDTEQEFARTWANEVAASASLIGLPDPDSSAITFALRARVAAIGTHCDEVLDEVAA